MKGQGQEQEQDKGKGRKMEEGRTPFSFIAGKFHSFWERTSFPPASGGGDRKKGERKEKRTG